MCVGGRWRLSCGTDRTSNLCCGLWSKDVLLCSTGIGASCTRRNAGGGMDRRRTCGSDGVSVRESSQAMPSTLVSRGCTVSLDGVVHRGDETQHTPLADGGPQAQAGRNSSDETWEKGALVGKAGVDAAEQSRNGRDNSRGLIGHPGVIEIRGLIGHRGVTEIRGVIGNRGVAGMLLVITRLPGSEANTWRLGST